MQIDFTYPNKPLTHTVGSNAFTYEYNKGIRTSQTVNGVKHTYTLSGSQIISEEREENAVFIFTMRDGTPGGMQFRDSSMAKDSFYTYRYETNLHGDYFVEDCRFKSKQQM